MGRRAKPKKVKATAKRRLAGKTPKDEGTKVRDLEQRLAETLEQQTATAAILHVISSSPTDIQPVLSAVAESAARLCHAYDVTVFRLEGDVLRLVAHHGPIPATPQLILPVTRDTVGGRTVVEARTIQVADAQLDDGEFPLAVPFARKFGHRTLLSVPLMRESVPIGVIQLRRTEVAPFNDAQIALLQTFADQAVIAIENVRLFNETKEALEQQTATAEILRVISSSPTDVQPVFDTIVASATRLCSGLFSAVYRYDGKLIHLVAHHNFSTTALAAARRTFPMPPSQGGATARAVLTREVVHIPDLRLDPEYAHQALARDVGFPSLLAVPMLREGMPIGAITVAGAGAVPFSDKQISLLQTFADQAVIAIENVRLFKELQARNADLTEALDQQMATSEILRVISSSPTDVQPVFDTITQNALKLCGAASSLLTTFDGEVLRLAALANVRSEAVDFLRRRFPQRLDRGGPGGRAILTRAAVHIPDTRQEPYFIEVGQVEGGTRSILVVPLLRKGEPIGTIHVHKVEPEPFFDSQIALLKSFADQAVIAVENVRLFKELQASNRELTTALDTQTATSDILRVISRSQTDVQPVFDAILASALRLLGGYSGGLTRIVGDQITLVAITSTDPAGDALQWATYPQPLHSERPHGQAIRSRAPINVADAQEDPRLPGSVRVTALARGFRSVVAVPLLRHEKPLGAIAVTRREPGGFTDDEIALLKTFADQAVIAIENARLFKELGTRNEELTQSLDRQTATAEILRVVSQSQTDVQPVFEAIAESAIRLLGAWSAIVLRYEAGLVQLAAARGGVPGSSEVLMEHEGERHPLDEHNLLHRTILTRTAQQIVDVETEETLGPALRGRARMRGWRSSVLVPMLRGDSVVGVISITRAQPGAFSPDDIALLQTFADQAVIALENARLLGELQARTQELTRSVEQLTALGDVGRAVSSSLDLDTVLTTIVGRAVHLSGTDGGTIFEYDEGAEEFSPRATLNADESQSALLRATRLRRGEGAVGQMAVTREPFQIPDIAAEGAYDSRLRGALLEAGTRAVLAIPLLHEERIVGGLVVTRRTPGAFTTEIVEILRTFATQSALAIQNARLFREIERKSRELEVASQHKSDFLANMSHELRTPLNAIIGFSEVLTERMFGELNEKQDEYLRDIYASGQHLLSLINDILDLSKIEAGHMELELTDFDLPPALDNALTLVRERAGRRGIALGQTVDERLGQIRGDERKVKQVLLNLLSNALKFTPEGGRVDVRAGLRDDLAEISVADTGVGIAPEDQEAVFEEFRQVGMAAKKVEGTGLGLALSRKFVELHGGRIWVRSQVGQGSTFTFTLPVRPQK